MIKKKNEQEPYDLDVWIMGPGNEGPIRPPSPWGGKRKERADQEAEPERLPEILAPNPNGGWVFSQH